MKILITGSDGYIGSLLAPKLLTLGHEVVGIDTGFYREGWLCPGGKEAPRTRSIDVRKIEPGHLVGFDAVVHLAELSNDPVGQLVQKATYEINHQGSVRLAKLARSSGVKYFVYTSSCSVYGKAGQEVIDEESPVNPQTAYAICKTLVEQDVRKLANDNFSPCFLRNATAYGVSPRMRFDIVLNNLAGLAWTTKEIRLTSDGSPWRPLVHALDICQAIVLVLQAPRQSVHNEIFNVGATSQNYRIRQIAEIVSETFPGCRVTYGSPSADNRSYRVSFEKIRKHLPGFSCAWDAQRGAQQLYDLFRRIDMIPEIFQHRAFTRLKMVEYLLRSGQIDDGFFWKE